MLAIPFRLSRGTKNGRDESVNFISPVCVSAGCDYILRMCGS